MYPGRGLPGSGFSTFVVMNVMQMLTHEHRTPLLSQLSHHSLSLIKALDEDVAFVSPLALHHCTAFDSARAFCGAFLIKLQTRLNSISEPPAPHQHYSSALASPLL